MRNRVITLDETTRARRGNGVRPLVRQSTVRPVPSTKQTRTARSYDGGQPIGLSYDARYQPLADASERRDSSRQGGSAAREQSNWMLAGLTAAPDLAPSLEPFDEREQLLPSNAGPIPHAPRAAQPMPDAEPVMAVRKETMPSKAEPAAKLARPQPLAEDAPGESESEALGFAKEIEELLASSRSKPERPAPAPAKTLPAEHPHSVFDRMDMSMASSFDGGSVSLSRLDDIQRTLDGRAARQRPRSRELGAPKVTDFDIVEDLARIKAAREDSLGEASSADQLQRFHAAVLDTMQRRRGGAFSPRWEGHGVSRDIAYAGNTLLKSSESTQGSYCVAATFQAFCEAYWAATGHTGADRWVADHPYDPWFRALQRMFFVRALEGSAFQTIPADIRERVAEEGAAVAIQWAGLGVAVGADSLQRGDFVQFWRSNGSGHSVIVWDVERDAGGGPAHLWYWSSQGHGVSEDGKPTGQGYGLNRESFAQIAKLYGARVTTIL
jgi:hypothetical protein